VLNPTQNALTINVKTVDYTHEYPITLLMVGNRPYVKAQWLVFIETL